MLLDIVIDTNVFMHSADDRQDGICETARAFLALLQTCETSLCVDPGFHSERARNRSYIAHEYYEHIGFAHPAFAVIVLLGRAGRIVETSRLVGPREGKMIRRLVTDRTDRVFVQVTFNSQSKTLISHDFRHIPIASRRDLRGQLGVNVTDAQEGCQELG
jgi:hypothetical protein